MVILDAGFWLNKENQYELIYLGLFVYSKSIIHLYLKTNGNIKTTINDQTKYEGK